MSDPLVFICKKKSMTQPSKVALRAAGILVVEVNDIAHCKLTRGEADVSQTQLLIAAMGALASHPSQDGSGQLNSAGKQKELFVTLLAEAIEGAKKL